LLVDDNPDDLQIITRHLEREFPAIHVVRSNTPGQFQQAVQEGNFNLVVTDFQLQWTDGLAVLRTIKQCHPYRPVIMFTATGTQEVAVQAMKSGLDDYIIKSPKHYERLAAAVRRSLLHTEAQRRAAELQIRLNALLTRLNIGVYRVDQSGTLLDCSPAFLRLLGASDVREAQIIYEAHFRTRLETWVAPARKPAVRGTEFPWQGGLRWFCVEEVISSEAEDVAVVEGLLQEITDRKQTERQLRAALDEMDVLLKERDRLLANERTLRDEAERLLHIKDQFLSTVSHELRTPLNSISGWAHLLLDGYIDGRNAKNALETIVRSVRTQTQIIDDLTDVAAIIT